MTISISNSENVALHPIRTRSSSEEFRLSSRHLSREFPVADTSFDVYYRENSAGVPFLWESCPGTPKIKTGKYPLPPLTPPPSFHSSPISRKPLKKQSRNNLMLIPKLNLKKAHLDHSPTSSYESSRDRVSSHPRMSCDSRFGARIDEDECESPVSTLCFGGGGRRSSGTRSPGCSSGIIRLLLRDFS